MNVSCGLAFQVGDIVAMEEGDALFYYRVVSVSMTSVELMSVRVHIQDVRDIHKRIPTKTVEGHFFNKLQKLEVLDMGDRIYRSMNNTHNPLRVFLNKLWTSTG